MQQQSATFLVPMWVCPVAPVLESAWVSLGVHVAVCVGIISVSACHICFPSHLGQQSPSSLPPPGARATIEGWATIPLAFLLPPPALETVALSIAPLIPTPPQAFLSHQTREGPRRRRGTRGDTLQGEGKKGGGTHDTGPFLPLFPNHPSLQL